MPGWNRLSAGLHLDDLRKFFEDAEGGRDYCTTSPSPSSPSSSSSSSSSALSRVSPGDVVGCGYEFGTGAVFFTHNGRRLPNAFVGVYVPRVAHDVYAVIGLEGGANELEVNFGSTTFRWRGGERRRVAG